MKHIATILMTLGLIGGSANAALYSRAGGSLVYDDVLNITWLQDANMAQTSGYDSDGRMTWGESVVWAQQLQFGGYSDWRLATMRPFSPYSAGAGFSMCLGGSVTAADCASSRNELGYMYFYNLQLPPPAYGVDLTGDLLAANGVVFFNIPQYVWSSTEYNEELSYIFKFDNGSSSATQKDFNYGYAWAVRDGDVAIPLPATLSLIGLGLLLIRTARR